MVGCRCPNAVAPAISGDPRVSVASQADRVQRLAAWLVTVGYLATVVFTVPLVSMTDELVAGWYTPIAGTAAALPGLVAGPLGLLRDIRWPRIALISCQIGFVIAIVLWFVAWEGRHINDARVSWLVMFPGLAAFAYVLVRPLGESLLQLVLGCLGVGLVVAVGSVDGLTHGLIADIMWPIILTSVFLMLATRFLDTARTYDAARANAVAHSVDAAALEARARERTRFDALVHDRVIATLIAVEPGAQDREVIAQATSALRELQRLASGGDLVAGSVDRDETLARLRAAARAVDDDVEVMIADAGDAHDGVGDAGDAHDVVGDVRADDPGAGGLPAAGYPTAVVDAVSEAVGEAVRNSVRHAGHAARIAVLIEANPASLRVTVADDGVGFDPAAVPPARLGIAVSIHRRMAALPGGWSRLSSVAATSGVEEGIAEAPDDAGRRGTTVQVGWAP